MRFSHNKLNTMHYNDMLVFVNDNVYIVELETF